MVPGLSGFLITERFRVQIIVIGEKGNESMAKKINHAIHVIFTENGTQVLKTMFKRINFELLEDAQLFLKTMNLHIQIAIKMRRPGKFNHRPDLLRISEKRNGRTKIEMHEPKCDYDLVQWQESISGFLKGMIRIAEYLIEVRERGFVHTDVKRKNILVHHEKFFLNDFKSCTPINYKATPEKYFTWCSTSEKLGIITSFSDVYGWAITFGCSLWDKYLLNLAKEKETLHSDALEKEVWKSLCEQELIPNRIISLRYSFHLETYAVDHDEGVKIHFLFYRFFKKILACDQANLKHYKENPDLPNPVPQITLEDCIAFVESLK